MNDGFVTVARKGEIAEGGVKVIRLGDQEIAVFRIGDEYLATEDVCTHDGGPLAEGILEGNVIECPRHGARFDLRTGEVLSLPAVSPIPTYPVRVSGDEIQVQWAAAGAPVPAAPVPAPAAERPAGDTSSSSVRKEVAAHAPTSTETSAPSQQEMAVRCALETVMDPEIGLSVIDLGLIRTVDIQPGKTRIDMLLTTPFCPYAPQMIADVKQATQSVVPQDCDVEILPDPWNPQMMPDPGLLGFSY